METRQDEDLYAILESSSSASFEELKAKYRKLVLQYHPDKVSEEKREASHFEFQRLDQAWKILSDPVLRCQYDTQQRADELSTTLVNDEIDLHEMTWDEGKICRGTQPRHQTASSGRRKTRRVNYDLTYYHPCRCGGDYILSQDHASGSRVISCSNCSLCIKVFVATNNPDKNTQSDMAKR